MYRLFPLEFREKRKYENFHLSCLSLEEWKSFINTTSGSQADFIVSTNTSVSVQMIN
jgi:hypothetical protein